MTHSRNKLKLFALRNIISTFLPRVSLYICILCPFCSQHQILWNFAGIINMSCMWNLNVSSVLVLNLCKKIVYSLDFPVRHYWMTDWHFFFFGKNIHKMSCKRYTVHKPLSTLINPYLYWPKLSWLNVYAARNVRPLGTRVWKSDYHLSDCNHLQYVDSTTNGRYFPTKSHFKPFRFEGRSKYCLSNAVWIKPFHFLTCEMGHSTFNRTG